MGLTTRLARGYRGGMTWFRRDQGRGVEGVIDVEYGAVSTRGLLVVMS